MNDYLVNIPTVVPALSIDTYLSDFKMGTLKAIYGCCSAIPVSELVQSGHSDLLEARSIVQLEDNAYIVLGQRLGVGKQGAVYSIAGNNDLCIKIGRNRDSQKQLRREIVGRKIFDDLGVSIPEILAHDSHGQWIVKRRWKDTGNCATVILSQNERCLSEAQAAAIRQCADRFRLAGFCTDMMPSNVLFRGDSIAFYESSLWSLKVHPNWSFYRCFLPAWLPDGFQESELLGFPPYPLNRERNLMMRSSRRNKAYCHEWIQELNAHGDLSGDWWLDC
jgi:hypothetical protein